MEVVRYGTPLLFLSGHETADKSTLERKQLQIVDGDSGISPQCLNGYLVRFGKRFPILFICQIQASQHRVSASDRNPKKALHSRMIGGETDRGGMITQGIDP